MSGVPDRRIQRRYEVGLVNDYASPATEKRGPYGTPTLAIEACKEFNRQLYPGRKSMLHIWPRWMWAEEGQIPLVDTIHPLDPLPTDDQK